MLAIEAQEAELLADRIRRRELAAAADRLLLASLLSGIPATDDPALRWTVAGA